MSTSSNKQQKKGKDGTGNTGKRKEMVKDWRVQQGTRVWASRVWVSCLWTSCVWGSCVWASCVWVSRVWAGCVRTSCEKVARCVWASFAWASCMWTSCVRTSCVRTRGRRLPRLPVVWASCQVVCEKVVCGQVVCGQVVCEKVVCGQEGGGRKVEVHVAKCHACHAKWRSMSPSATPATQSAVSATPATQSGGPCRQVPRLPRKVTLYVAKCRKQRRRPRRQLGTKHATRASPVP